ncbi:MAG: hypothetical protein V4714_10310 [Bacteroidota bacterium]
MNWSNLVQLQTVANGLQELKEQVVFVGGATVCLYATDVAATEVRPTDDVDCVIELTSRKALYALEERLRSIGFQNDTRDRAPVCRWIYQSITVDIMPTDATILGFSNRWYEEGIRQAVWYRFPNGQTIKLFTSPYFVASKLEALWARGWKDIRISTDFEDIVYIFDNRPSLEEEINKSPQMVKDYLTTKFRALLQRTDIDEGIECALPFGSGASRMQRIKSLMQNI